MWKQQPLTVRHWRWVAIIPLSAADGLSSTTKRVQTYWLCFFCFFLWLCLSSETSCQSFTKPEMLWQSLTHHSADPASSHFPSAVPLTQCLSPDLWMSLWLNIAASCGLKSFQASEAPRFTNVCCTDMQMMYIVCCHPCRKQYGQIYLTAFQIWLRPFVLFKEEHCDCALFIWGSVLALLDLSWYLYSWTAVCHFVYCIKYSNYAKKLVMLKENVW